MQKGWNMELPEIKSKRTGKTKPLSFRMDESLLSRIESIAKIHNLNKTEMIVYILENAVIELEEKLKKRKK